MVSFYNSLLSGCYMLAISCCIWEQAVEKFLARQILIVGFCDLTFVSSILNGSYLARKCHLGNSGLSALCMRTSGKSFCFCNSFFFESEVSATCLF